MRTAVIFAEGVKQIIFTPENKDEEFALSLISANDDIDLLIKDGLFGENYHNPFQANVSKCQGGYLRLYSDDKSKILVLTPKKEKTKIPIPFYKYRFGDTPTVSEMPTGINGESQVMVNKTDK